MFRERRFRYLIKEYVKYYNTVRPHSAMNNMPLDYKIPNAKGKIKGVNNCSTRRNISRFKHV